MEAYDRACRELNITQPKIEVLHAIGPNKRYGDYTSGIHRVRLFLRGITAYERDGLRFAQSELTRTLLHELRHGWQAFHSREMWEAANEGPREQDAESWAVRKVAEYRNIVRLSRSFPNSGFSRLSRHAVRR